MSARRPAPRPKARAGPPGGSAPIFAALGDRTRLRLLGALAAGSPLSIARLTEGSMLTRQAVTKHLRVLRDARLVRSVRRGREMRFELSGAALDRARRTLTAISWRWDEALARLNAHVER